MVEGGGQELAGHPVPALGLQRQGALAHPGELGAGPLQVAAFRFERVRISGRHEGRPYAGSMAGAQGYRAGGGTAPRRPTRRPREPLVHPCPRGPRRSHLPAARLPREAAAGHGTAGHAAGRRRPHRLVRHRRAGRRGDRSRLGRRRARPPARRPTGSASASCCSWSPRCTPPACSGVLALTRTAPRPGRWSRPARSPGCSRRRSGRWPGCAGWRWSAGPREPEAERQRVTQAFALEGATDEASFVAGPALVGLLASLVGPQSVPVVIAVLSLTAVMAFALHPTARAVRPSHTPHLTAARRGGLPGGVTTVLLLVGGCPAGSGLRWHPGRRHQPDRRARPRGRRRAGLRAARPRQRAGRAGQCPDPAAVRPAGPAGRLRARAGAAVAAAAAGRPAVDGVAGGHGVRLRGRAVPHRALRAGRAGHPDRAGRHRHDDAVQRRDRRVRRRARRWPASSRTTTATGRLSPSRWPRGVLRSLLAVLTPAPG